MVEVVGTVLTQPLPRAGDSSKLYIHKLNPESSLMRSVLKRSPFTEEETETRLVIQL